MNETSDPTQESIEDLQGELRWDELFRRTESQLATAARRARQQIAASMVAPMDYEQL